MSDLPEAVKAEIVTLHEEFERWLRGESDSLERVEAALADDFTIAHPRGGVVAREPLLAGLRDARGTRPIRIRIENVALRRQEGETALATYEEWHDHDDYTTARQSSVLFRVNQQAPGGLTWLHVHETFKIPPPSWSVPDPG